MEILDKFGFGRKKEITPAKREETLKGLLAKESDLFAEVLRRRKLLESAQHDPNLTGIEKEELPAVKRILENREAELRGLRDRISLMQDVEHRKGEKAAEQLKQ